MRWIGSDYCEGGDGFRGVFTCLFRGVRDEVRLSLLAISFALLSLWGVFLFGVVLGLGFLG